MNAAVLTISDTAHRGEREDISGPAVAARLRELGWTITLTEILPDDAPAITARVRSLSSDLDIHAVFTTGGTGIAPRDVTPEAVRPVLSKEIPGLAELMRLEGRKKSPRAVLSRSIAGLAGSTLVLTLPGSPKGAIESLDAVAALLPHIIDLAAGRTAHPAAG
ncbi:MAG: MogA/MoaB family molybdenum cofactor biosynthesis protein [Bryobacteraceae bacterium]|nr:MogA/MoaB family molybdenum cofactor biosynthesis protein [Solibacteraceae bacterium]MCO5350156.1 MogA/MoaB family molybdenum cofactor biosynthesis protein [Bryobacteraceae bacterium]